MVKMAAYLPYSNVVNVCNEQPSLDAKRARKHVLSHANQRGRECVPHISIETGDRPPFCNFRNLFSFRRDETVASLNNFCKHMFCFFFNSGVVLVTMEWYW